MARVVTIATDLMLASRVDAMLTAAGHHVIARRARSQEAPLDEAELVVADLDVADPGGAGRRSGIPVLGYYSHVDVDTRDGGRGGRARPGRAALADGPRTAGAGRAAAQG